MHVTATTTAAAAAAVAKYVVAAVTACGCLPVLWKFIFIDTGLFVHRL
jgi:hypothetical protein